MSDKVNLVNDLEKLRSRCREHIMIMLGAPVVKLELDDKHITHCVSFAQDTIETSPKLSNFTPAVFERAMQELSLAYAKMILGRIRSKYSCADGTTKPADGFDLLEEGQAEVNHWKKCLGIC